MPAESRLCYRKHQNSAQTQTELEGLENVLSLAPKWMLSCKYAASFTTRLCWKTHMNNPGEQTRLAPCWRARVQRQEQEAGSSQLKAGGESGRRRLQLAEPSWETRQAALPLLLSVCHESSSYHGECCQMNNREDNRTDKRHSPW